MTSLPKILIVLLILLLTCSPVSAERERVALVIGNSNYDLAPLRNPSNDATDIANLLEKMDFKVTKLINAKQKQMEHAIRSFTNKLTKDSISLFYFAGHGVELDGENYLVPLKADIETESDVRYEAVAVGRLLDGMYRTNNNLNIVILDACRNNPYSRSFRSLSRGLAEMRPASGTMIFYATEPGNVAADGSGRNGLFTEQLMKNIKNPNLKVEEAFKETAIAVNNITAGKQVPWYEGIILGQFYFYPKSQRKLPENANTTISEQTTQYQESAEITFWKIVMSNPNEKGYRAYLRQWPSGKFASLAKLRISEDISQKEALQLSKDEITSMFSGKTVEGYHHRKKYRFKNYFDPNGTLKGFNLKKNKHFTGIWKAEENYICRKWKNKENKCRKIQISNGIVQQFDPYDNLAVTYESFTDGDIIKETNNNSMFNF